MTCNLSSKDHPSDRARARSLARLYRRHHKPLMRSVQHTGNLDAEDIVHDAFERLASASTTWGVRQPSSYLYATARRLANEADCRHKYRYRACSAPAPLAEDLAFSPEDILAGQHRLTAVFHAIINLPRPQCQVLLLARFDERSPREVSGHLNVPRTIVQDHLLEATQACRRAAG